MIICYTAFGLVTSITKLVLDYPPPV